MPLTADRVVVELEAKLGKYEANVARAEQKFDRAMGNIQKSATRTEGIISRAAGRIGAAFSAVSVLALARGLLNLADAAKTLDAQLRVATRESGNFAQAQEDVRRIATETRSGLDETARLYGRIVLNSRELGVTQEQAARATETFTKALKLGGATTQETSSATIQFAQALASGVLRGDELRSILEASPRFARLLADSLNVTVGALRDMGEEGTLTADKLIKALTNQRFTEGIDAEFRELPVTFDQAMTLVHNAAIETFGAFDRGGQFSTMIANFVADGADGMGDFASSAEDAGARVRAEFEGLAAVFRNALDELGLFKTFLDSLGGGDVVNRAATITGDILNPIGAIIRNSPAYQQAQQKALGEAALRKVMAGDPFRDFPQLRGSGSTPRPRPTATTKPSGRKRSGGATRSPLDPEAFAREEARLNDQILALKADEATTAEAKAAIEIDRLKAAQARDAAETSVDKKLTDEQRRQLIAIQGVVYSLETARVIRERDKDIAERNQKAADEAFEARRVNLRYELDALESQAQLADTRQDRLAIERTILDHLESQERAELEAAILANKNIDAIKARGDLAAAQAGRRGDLERGLESPLEAYRRHLNRSPDAINDEIEGFVVDELERVQDSIASGLTKALGIDNPLIDRLVSLFLEQQIIRPIMEGLANKSGGGGGGILGAIFGAAASAIGGGIGGGIGNGSNMTGAIWNPGFASGGSMTLGGRGGTDRNVLALNGRPVANVSRGERLHVESKALGPARGGSVVISAPQFDLRGAVMTRELYADMERISKVNAARAGAASYERAIRDAPAAVVRKQRYGS